MIRNRHRSSPSSGSERSQPASRVQARGRSGLTRRFTLCARPFPLPVWLPTSAPHGPGDGDGNTLPGVVGAMRVIPSLGCPMADRVGFPMSTPSVGGCASQLVWFGQRGIHWACQAHQILSERQNIATRRLAACLCLVPDVCGLCQRPAAIPQQIVSDSPCQHLSSEGVSVSSQLVWSGQRGIHWACQVRQISPEK